MNRRHVHEFRRRARTRVRRRAQLFRAIKRWAGGPGADVFASRLLTLPEPEYLFLKMLPPT